MNRLPPEILSLIAQSVAKDDDDDAISIVPLTHVCRYWRESIISTPENWASISGSNQDMVAVSLERAKAAPLKISFNMLVDREFPSFADTVGPYFHNTRTLAVSFIPSLEKFANMFPDFPQSMPTLQSLTLTMYVGGMANQEMSTDIFETFTPSLKVLSLGHIPLYPSLLELRTLTELTICDSRFNTHLDTLLEFLEGNRSLESATLEIDFLKPSLRTSRRRNGVKNQLRSLCVESYSALDIQVLISSIPLRGGSHLGIDLVDEDAKLGDILPGVSTAHLSNPQLPTFFELEIQRSFRRIVLRGPGGTFTFKKRSTQEEPYEDFSALPLTNVRKVHLSYSWTSRKNPVVPHEFSLSSFPLLETLVVERGSNVLQALSGLLSNPSSSPTLKTLAFVDCDLTEEFMEGLTRFASERQITATSTWLYRVSIVRKDGVFPNAASIHKLGRHVKVVDVRMGDGLPADMG